MLNLTLAGRPLDLRPGTTLSLEFHNSLFDDNGAGLTGTFSFAFTLPLTPRNRAEFGYPDVVESLANVRRVFDECALDDDGFSLGQRGELRMRRVLAGELVEVVVAFGMSRTAAALKQRGLREYDLGGMRVVPAAVPSGVFGVAFPGMPVHANAVADNPQAYDYVFAPLRLRKPQVDEAQPPEYVMVNEWGYDTFGIRPFGSFRYVIPVNVPGGPVVAPPVFTMSPYPWLRYVLQRVFAGLGLVATQPLPGELNQLVVLNARTSSATGFDLAQLLPNLTGTQLLAKLRAALGLAVEVTPAGVVGFTTLEHVLTDDAYDDWSLLAAPGFEERVIEAAQGVTLTYHVATNDAAAAAMYKQPENPPPAGPAVATAADLPVYLDQAEMATLPPQRRYVQDEYRYYTLSVRLDWSTMLLTAAWLPGEERYLHVDVAGGGTERDQGVAATAVELVQNSIAPYLEQALMPVLPDGSEAEQEELRLAFYRGYQPLRIDAAHPYAQQQPHQPLLTPFNQAASGQRAGDNSLQLHGPDGTATRWLRRWLTFVATATPITHRFNLTPAHLAGWRPQRKVMVQGNLYLVRKIALQAPITGAATVELWPVPAQATA